MEEVENEKVKGLDDVKVVVLDIGKKVIIRPCALFAILRMPSAFTQWVGELLYAEHMSKSGRR